MWAMTWAWPFFTTLWVIGAVRAFVLPVLPFLYIITFGALWLLAILEAAIAMVVWVFGFVRMDGDEFLAQQSKMGAFLVFQVFLMPTLGILAFAACFILLPIIVGTVEMLWATAYYAQTGGSYFGMGPASLVVGFVIITFLTMYLMMHLFAQVFHVPDKVISWFGAPGRDFTDKSLFATAATMAAGTLGKGMPGLPSIPRKGGGDGDNGGGKGGSNGMGHRNLSPMAAKAAEPKVLD
jgi:hypothetical protein